MFRTLISTHYTLVMKYFPLLGFRKTIRSYEVYKNYIFTDYSCILAAHEIDFFGHLFLLNGEYFSLLIN